MEQITVSVVNATSFSLKAEKWSDDVDKVDYIEIQENAISSMVFDKINRGTSIEIFSDGKSLGFFALVAKSQGKIVVAQGDLDSIFRA